MRSYRLVMVFLGILALSASGCSKSTLQTPSASVPNRPVSSMEFSDQTASWHEAWQNLSVKLQRDGLDTVRTNALFARLDMPPSAVPMGIKVKANAKKCRDFIDQHAVAFARAELNYGVPSEVAAALLFVETRLGGYLGKHNAFYMLASMAVTRDPADIPEYMSKLPGSEGQIPWIREKMAVKADWAYKELKALLSYCYANGIDPLKVKGSVYGAMGLCQFMPSNISRYGVDGNADGVIDLFTVDDAVASLSNYLRRNGWRSGLSVTQQTRVLRTYNAMDIYAHTILALARTIRQLG